MNPEHPAQHEEELRPPAHMTEFVGGGDFTLVGETFLGFLRHFADLKPHDRVLDVGCGCGRIALPLTRYLAPEGGYEGFDIYREGVQWCSEQITPRFPHFRFQVVDIFNKRYNPTGTLAASLFRFPYENHSFDLVVVSSVFTHLRKKEMVNYLSEISRVLKKGGRCLMTFFLFHDRKDPDSPPVDPDRSGIDFRFHCEPYRTATKEEPEFAVAYEEEFIRRELARHGLEIREPIHYGLQDILVAVKSGGKLSQWWRGKRAEWRRMREEKRLVPEEDIPAPQEPEVLLPRNGIWTDPTQKLNLFIQTYEPRSLVIILTLDGVGFVAFRRENLEDTEGSIRIPMDVGKQGYWLTLELSDPSHGVVTARIPTGELRTSVSCTLPAAP